MNVLKRIVVMFMVTALIVSNSIVFAAEQDSTASEEKRVITDMSGNEIVLPDTVDSYAVAWAGLTDILLMFDGTEHLAAYPEKSASFAWIFDVFPDYENKLCLSNDGISAEEIIESGVSVVFLKAADDENLYDKLNKCGIAAIDCKFDTYEELESVVKMIANVLGTESSLEKAEMYCEYLDNIVVDTISFSDNIDENERVSALVMKDTKDFSAYGSSRYTGKWVEMCGGNYSMVNEDSYANVNLTKEQIFEYNPDYIFFAMPNQVEKFLEDPTWADLSAVKNGKVYNVPGGFNTWSNCGAESALVFKWAASIMYPDTSDFNINQEIKDFYLKFYGYEPSDEEISKILESSF